MITFLLWVQVAAALLMIGLGVLLYVACTLDLKEPHDAD